MCCILIAFERAKKFEYHYTPKNGSWLNMVETEISALSRQCLDRRIGDIETLAKEVARKKIQRFGSIMMAGYSRASEWVPKTSPPGELGQDVL